MDSSNFVDPAFVSGYSGLDPQYKYVTALLRWALVRRGSDYYPGWVLCDPDGKAMDWSGTGTIIINAQGSYPTKRP
jgi:hypothetical protein